MTVAPDLSQTVAPTGPLRRPPPDGRSAWLPDPDAAGRPRRSESFDDTEDPEDLAKWFAYYLAALLVALLTLGGLWISIFAL